MPIFPYFPSGYILMFSFSIWIKRKIKKRRWLYEGPHPRPANEGRKERPTRCTLLQRHEWGTNIGQGINYFLPFFRQGGVRSLLGRLPSPALVASLLSAVNTSKILAFVSPSSFLLACEFSLFFCHHGLLSQTVQWCDVSLKGRMVWGPHF